MLPHFLIIGTKKGGTTSLHYYLSLHPQLFLSEPKELMFFTSPNWERGVEWYEKHFVSDGRKCGEASPDYTWYPRQKDVPKRIFSLMPHCKMIYIVRDPVDRMLSNHAQWVGSLNERRPFREIIDLPEYQIYFDAGRYFFQIEQYLQYFQEDALHIMTLEDLAADPRLEMTKVCDFLDVDPEVLPAEKLTRRLNRTEDKRQRNSLGNVLYPPRVQHWLKNKLPWRVRLWLARAASWHGTPLETARISDADRERLAHPFREDFAKLRAFTGMAFENWRSVRYLA